jgi:hypothetical protein
MTGIQQCKDVISLIEGEYPVGDETVLIEEAPGKILQGSKMTLWAQSNSGSKYINIRMPSLRRFLERLADQGPRHSMEESGIKFKFIPRKFPQ